MEKYVYPKGDFLSGFSEGDEICDYELECQRMVSRGVQYLDEHPEIFTMISNGGVSSTDRRLHDMIDFMCKGGDDEGGQTGAMVSHTVNHSYYAKKIGWEKYIQKLTEKTES